MDGFKIFSYRSLCLFLDQLTLTDCLDVLIHQPITIEINSLGSLYDSDVEDDLLLFFKKMFQHRHLFKLDFSRLFKKGTFALRLLEMGITKKDYHLELTYAAFYNAFFNHVEEDYIKPILEDIIVDGLYKSILTPEESKYFLETYLNLYKTNFFLSNDFDWF